jgi:DNA-binding MarR family transcriptional regulator
VQKLHKALHYLHMLTDTLAIRNYFAKLGLETEVADIYLALHTHGPQAISQLARTSHVERTRIYRLIDTLLASNLIEVETRYKRGVIKAAPISNLRILITQKEQDLRSLQDELELIEQVLARNSLSSPATRVQFYQGSEGIRQMLWNELNAKTEILGYNYRILEESTGKKFMERWTEAFEERQLHCRLLSGDDFAKSWAEGTKKTSGIGTGQRVKGMDYHCIAPADFRITHSCNMYDNVVGYYHWKDGEVFGIETYNQEIADSQRQFFELLWAKSQPETRF